MRRFAKHPFQSRGGFTLIEAAVTTAIIGFAVCAVVELLANGNRASGECIQTMTAMHLAQDVREYTMPLTPAQIDALNAKAYDPPIDARGQRINNLAGWRQTISVTGADLDRLTLNVPVASSDMRRISVTISHNGQAVFNLKWLSADTSD